MHFIVKYFPEITIKSAPVRKRFTQQLGRNLKSRLRAALDCGCRIERGWDRMDIAIDSDDGTGVEGRLDGRGRAELVREVLATTPGIAYFAKVSVFEFNDPEHLAALAADYWRDLKLSGTFCVRVKRSGRHDFASTDIERLVGARVLQDHPQARVKLKDPDHTLRLEVAHNRCFVIHAQQSGLGGFPLGTADSVVSLVSGGFDSTVASYLTMRRGLLTHFLFFNLGGPAHELGVKEVSYFLWRKYGSSHPVKFISVPFEGVVKTILQTIDRSQMGVVLKRMMLRLAERVAAEMRIKALVTGESVAQVASQTLINLSVIDSVANTLVLRPLVSMDKGDIINLARQIGTEDFSAQIPEYCGVISVKPTTRASEARVAQEEAGFPWEELDRAFNHRQEQSITQVEQGLTMDLSVHSVAEPLKDAVVVDIRHPTEVENAPLTMTGTIIKTIPFYYLSEQFPRLDQGVHYLLYCDQGVMSQLHAARLKASGFHNVGVFRP